jgi:choline-sulfatase
VARRAFRTLSVAAALCIVSCRPQSGAPGARRSIVLITIDTLRADRVNAQTTPALAALEREAAVFDDAVTVAPLTLPAHASLLTGVYPPRHRVRDNELFTLPQDVPTLPTQLKQRGYATAAFVSAVVLDHRYGLNRGFDLYDDEIEGPERSGAATLARAERWLDAAPQPFFLWVHLFEPHAPYRTGSYESEVRAADAALDEFFGFLRRKHLWDDVVLSVSSDHGESLGEHREQTHGFFLYEATMRIPWILKAPALAARRFPHLVRIVDELPTAIDLAGADRGFQSGPGPTLDGISLMPFLSDGRSPGVEAYGETFLPRDQFGWSELTSIRTARWKYIEGPAPELYDLAGDPGETTNAIGARSEDAATLRRVLGAVARASHAPPQRSRADPALSEKLMSLGYIGSAPAASEAAGAPRADPKDKIEVYNLVMSALELSEGGNLPGALGALQQAERLDPNVAQIAFLEGTLLGRLGRYDQAAAALERTLALSPSYTAARFRLALAWLRTGRADRAARALQDVVREQPDDFRAWHNLAAIAYSRGDLDEAEALERKALALSPEYAEAWNTLGAIALVRRHTADAVDALSNATRLNPHNAQAFQNLALALQAGGQRDRARAAADRACALDKRLCKTGQRP